MYDLVIVGGGPAAMSAAAYALDKGINFVMVFEEIGGQVGWVQSFWGPQQHQYLPSSELIHVLTTRIRGAPTHLRRDRAVKVTRAGRAFAVETLTQGTLVGTAVLIATGATPRTLSMPNAHRLLDPRLHYSITTYAHLAAGRRVAVIGAGPRALRGVAELIHSDASVYLIVPDGAELATPFGQSLRRQPKLEVLEGYDVQKVAGDDTVEELLLVREGTTRRLLVDRAFVSLDLYPNSELVKPLVETDPNGSIRVNEHHETSMPGIYAAGDVTTMRSEQVAVSIGDGARAAARAYDYLLAEWFVFGPLAPADTSRTYP